MFSESSDEEDIHQCGRCKETFTDVQLYFDHKQTKKCTKVKSTNITLNYSPAKRDGSTKTAQFREKDSISEVSGYARETRITILDTHVPASQGDSRSLLVNPCVTSSKVTSDADVVAPAKKRRAAREMGKENSSSDSSLANVVTDAICEVLQVPKPRASKRRHTVKNFKKAWAENYQDLQQRSHEMSDFPVPVKKRKISKNSDSDQSVPCGENEEDRNDDLNTKSKSRFEASTKTYGSQNISPLNISPIVIVPTPGFEHSENEKQDGEDEENVVRLEEEPRLFRDLDEPPSPLQDVRKSTRKLRNKPKAKTNSGYNALGKKSKIYWCPVCDYKASYKDEFDRHLRTEHQLKDYFCPKCLERFPDCKALRQHMEDRSCTEASGGSDSLTKVTKVRNKYRIRKHFIEKCKNLVFKVRIPYFDNEIELDVNKEGNEELHGFACVSFKCNLCETVCCSYMAIISHLKEHNNIFQSICQYCGKWFPSHYKLYRHISSTIHDHLSQEEVLETKKTLVQLCEGTKEICEIRNGRMGCAQCAVECKTKALLDKHVLHRHVPVTLIKQYRCARCGVDVGEMKALSKHLAAEHGGEKADKSTEYVCPVCDRKFTQKTYCIRHRQTLHMPTQQVPFEVDSHSADRDSDWESQVQQKSFEYECFVCRNVLFSKAAYKNHMTLHKAWIPHPDLGSNPPDLFDNIKNPDTNEMVLKINVKVTDQRLADSNSGQSSAAKSLKRIESTKKLKTMNSVESQKHAVSVLQKLADNIPKPSEKALVRVVMENNGAVSIFQDEGESDSEAEVPDDMSGYAHQTNNDTQCNDWHDLHTVNTEELRIALSESENSANTRLLCPYCLKLTDTLAEMYQHKTQDHQLIAVYCCVKPECKKTFDTLEEYENHSVGHSQGSFICCICNMHTNDMGSLQIHKTCSHRAVHSMDTGHCCQVCHMTFASEKALRDHVVKDAHQQCRVCRKVFKNKSELVNHERLHTGEQPFLCDQCGATFTSKLILNRHRLTHNPRRHKCEHCGQMFNKREHLRRHVDAKHSSAKPFVCEHPGCESAFKRKDKLKDHMKFKHSADKPFKCDICGRSYGYREGLRYHQQKTHAVRGKFPCSVCGVTFTRPSMLQQHVTSQHGVERSKTKIYNCDECDMAFQRPERLNRHKERTHQCDVDWPIKCHICEKGFAGEKSRETHIRIKHGDVKKKRVSKVDKFIAETNAWSKEVTNEKEDRNVTANSKVTPEVHQQKPFQDLMQQAMNETIHVDSTAYSVDPNTMTIEYQPPNVAIGNEDLIVVPTVAMAHSVASDLMDQPHTVQWTPQPIGIASQIPDSTAMHGTVPIRMYQSSDDKSSQLIDQPLAVSQHQEENKADFYSSQSVPLTEAQSVLTLPLQDIASLPDLPMPSQSQQVGDTLLPSQYVLAEFAIPPGKSQTCTVTPQPQYNPPDCPSSQASRSIIKPPKKQRKATEFQDTALGSFTPEANIQLKTEHFSQPNSAGTATVDHFPAEKTTQPKDGSFTLPSESHSRIDHFSVPRSNTTLETDQLAKVANFPHNGVQTQVDHFPSGVESVPSKIEHFPCENITTSKIDRQSDNSLFIPEGPLPAEMKGAQLLIQLQNEAIAHQQQIDEQAKRKRELDKGKVTSSKFPVVHSLLQGMQFGGPSAQFQASSATIGVTGTVTPSNSVTTGLNKQLQGIESESKPQRSAKDLLAEFLVQNIVPGNPTALKFGFTNKSNASKSSEYSVSVSNSSAPMQSHSSYVNPGTPAEVKQLESIPVERRTSQNMIESELKHLLKENELRNILNSGRRDKVDVQTEVEKRLDGKLDEPPLHSEDVELGTSSQETRGDFETKHVFVEVSDTGQGQGAMPSPRYEVEGQLKQQTVLQLQDLVQPQQIVLDPNLKGLSQNIPIIIPTQNMTINWDAVSSGSLTGVQSTLQWNASSPKKLEKTEVPSQQPENSIAASSVPTAISMASSEAPIPMTTSILVGQGWPLNQELIAGLQNMIHPSFMLPNQIGAATTQNNTEPSTASDVSGVSEGSQLMVMTLPFPVSASATATKSPPVTSQLPNKHTPSILARNLNVSGSPKKLLSKDVTPCLYQQLTGSASVQQPPGEPLACHSAELNV